MKKTAIFLAGMVAAYSSAAYAIDHPPMKEGLWQIKTQIVDNPGSKKSGGTVSLCRDHASDQRTEALAKHVKGCAVSNESLVSGRYSADTRCEIGSTVIISKGVTTFPDANSSHSEIHVTYTPAFAGNTDETMI